MQQQDNHEYPFLYQRQTCHQVQPNQATYQKRQKCQPATYLQEGHDSTVDIYTFYVPHRHVYAEQYIKFMKDGVNATPPPTVNTTGYIDHAAFLGTINPDTNKIPKHLFQGYLNIYNNYFKAPWMPDRTEANPNELNQDDARYGFRCCHLKNIWTEIGRAVQQECRDRSRMPSSA